MCTTTRKDIATLLHLQRIPADEPALSIEIASVNGAHFHETVGTIVGADFVLHQ
jgi:hypothetical protein